MKFFFRFFILYYQRLATKHKISKISLNLPVKHKTLYMLRKYQKYEVQNENHHTS